MSRRKDLERLIRESYELFRRYEEKIRTSEQSEETLRGLRESAKQQRLIEGYLKEYSHLIGGALPPGIAEIAARLSQPARRLPQSKAQRSKSSRVWTWMVGVALGLFLSASLVVGLWLRLQSPVTSIMRPVTPTATLAAGATRIREVDHAVMVYVPAGEFWMGSSDKDPLAVHSEKPLHRVYVDAFWIDRTEVTNAQYRQCVAAGACSPPSDFGSHTRDDYYDNPEFDDHPVIYVTWYQARAYAEWVGGRLPTEAEWEYAARGPNGYIYPWGNKRPLYGEDVSDTKAVGSRPGDTSWCGVLDMAGNVWEWTQSLYRDYPYDPSDGREDSDARGYRVFRGGSFLQSNYARCARRSRNLTVYADMSGGFRVVVPLPIATE